MMKSTGQSVSLITVRQKPGNVPALGLLEFLGHTVPCQLGRNGITTRKREGDLCTPSGTYNLLSAWIRKERTGFIQTQLPVTATTPHDGWCDDPSSPAYNSHVKLPFAASHETLQRDDRLYDVCIVMDHNIHPRTRGLGSAIFFHLTNPESIGTAGCIAIEPDHMFKLLPVLSPNTRIKILP